MRMVQWFNCSHIICKVHIMVPLQIRKWICQPNHINIIVHHTISKLQNLQQMAWPPCSKVEETLRTKLVGSFGVEDGRDEDGVARPKQIDPVERSVVLGDDKDHVLALLHGNADEPVVEEGQVGLAHNADDDGGTVFGDEGERLF